MRGGRLKEYINTLDIKTPITFIENPIYDKTNNIYSLSLAKDYLIEDDTLLFESDLIFEDSVLDALVTDTRDTLALVDKYESWMDGTCVKLDCDDNIDAFIPGKSFKYDEIKDYYKTVNIYKFSKQFSKSYYVPFLKAYQSALGENEYYEQVLRVITMLDEPVIKAKRLTSQRWYEIDDIQDLNIAESIFTPDDNERVSLLQKRYGGYWRYPKLLDFCYLVNPYFPTEKMKDEMRASFDTLLINYPSGMGVNSLLAAKNFGVHSENILVGNGAAELIKALMSCFTGKTGFIRPTFDEYPNRYDRENSIDFIPQKRDYLYTAEDIINFFAKHKVQNLVVVNPDNPTGNYIPKNDIIKLLSWSSENKIKLVIDESFVDFADETDASLIEQSLLTDYPQLYVMKSISKSYGVPGLRLGVLASGDIDTIARLKKDVAIWNINSFGEFYMQIEEKYKKDYSAALAKIKAERTRFQDELSKIDGIRVIPSQANFVMVEVESNIDVKELLKTLLVKHNLMIKELSTKTNGKNYLRLAIRNTAENDVLLSALRQEIKI